MVQELVEVLGLFSWMTHLLILRLLRRIMSIMSLLLPPWDMQGLLRPRLLRSDPPPTAATLPATSHVDHAVAPPCMGHAGSGMLMPATRSALARLELDLPADDSDDQRQGPLWHRWNRKLQFHLTQEILADLLHLDDKGASSATRLHGPALLSKVWSTEGVPGGRLQGGG